MRDTVEPYTVVAGNPARLVRRLEEGGVAMHPERPPRAKIIVFGILFWYPLAGVTYQFLHYLIGLKRLGYDPYYIEDSARWVYDPRKNDLSPDASGNIDCGCPGAGSPRLLRSLGVPRTLSGRQVLRNDGGAGSRTLSRGGWVSQRDRVPRRSATSTSLARAGSMWRPIPSPPR